MAHRSTPPLTDTQKRLATDNLRLADKAVKLARRDSGYKEHSSSELLSYAYDGLIVAARLFDRRCKFSTYAMSCMMFAIRSGVNNDQFQANRVKFAKRWRLHFDRLEQKLGRPPTIDELYDKETSQLITKETLELLLRGHGRVQIDSEIKHETEEEEEDVRAPLTEGVDDRNPEQLLIDRQQIDLLSKYVKLLPARQKFVIEQHFFHERSLKEIAEQLSVSRQAVHQFKDLAVARLVKKKASLVC